MNFKKSLDLLFKHEGGYSNHAADPGGQTAYGITEAVARQNGYAGRMIDMPKSVAEEIYRRQYWAPVRADELPAAVRFHVFDAAVNSGVRQSVLWLQRAAGVTPDGIIGPQTLRAVKQADPQLIVRRFNAQRLKFLTDLPTWPNFGKGWARRVATNLLEA